MNKNNQKILTLKIGGAAGQGVKASGLLFARFAARSGYYIYNYTEFPSIIKGGHNVIQVNISEQEVLGPSNKCDVLVALNQETIKLHIDEMTEGAAIVYDGDRNFKTDFCPEHVKLCPVPLGRLAEEAGNKNLLLNMVAVGAVAGLLGGDLEILLNFVAEQFEDKGEEVVAMDKKAAEMGYNYAKENFAEHIMDTVAPKYSLAADDSYMIVNGNEAAALGAISGGMQFAAIYPMSPISPILHVLAKHQEEFGYVYKQPEDEISAINMAIGAAFGGARSLTATSGGGFCLMAEGYGLAGITETPVVIIEGMRGSPATGIPTWSEQGDLRFVIHAHQGDFPRIVLTPGDAKETFDLTMKALNLAEKYQTAVVVLIDKNICENDQRFPLFDASGFEIDRGKFTTETIENYERYAMSDDGISLRAPAGTGNFYISNSDEHTTEGYSNEEIEVRNAQMNKRMQKMITCAEQDMEAPVLHGPKDADLTIVSWGSNKGSILQALKHFDNVNFLQITWMNPFPTENVKEVLENSNYVLNVECNYSGQLNSLIREHTLVEVDENLLKYDGRPFFVEELRDKFESVLKGLSS